MKKLIGLLLFSSFVFLLTGCTGRNFLPNKTEIKGIALIQMAGIDRTEDSLIKMSVMKNDINSVDSMSTATGGKDSAGAENEQEDGRGLIFAADKTMAKVENTLQKKVDKTLFFGHIDYLIFGESCAKEDMYKYIDYISRQYHFRMNALVYITKSNADDFLGEAAQLDFSLHDYMDVFLADKTLTTATKKKSMIELFSESFEDQKISVIPLIGLKEGSETEKVWINGYGILQDLKLKFYLEGDAAVGYNILTNQYQAGMIDIKDPGGDDAALSVVTITSKMSPVFKNGELEKINIKCFAVSSLAEDHKRYNYANKENYAKVTGQQRDRIEEYVKKCIQISQENQCDFIEVFKDIRVQNKKLYDRVKNDWGNFYKDIQFEVSVDSRINRIYDFREGSG